MNIPLPKPLPGQVTPTPYVVVADDAFPIKSYKMNMTQRVYNYRLSKARRVVENAFGICANRFRILRRHIDVCPAKTTAIIMAIFALHNYLSSINASYGRDDEE